MAGIGALGLGAYQAAHSLPVEEKMIDLKSKAYYALVDAADRRLQQNSREPYRMAGPSHYAEVRQKQEIERERQREDEKNLARWRHAEKWNN